MEIKGSSVVDFHYFSFLLVRENPYITSSRYGEWLNVFGDMNYERPLHIICSIFVVNYVK